VKDQITQEPGLGVQIYVELNPAVFTYLPSHLHLYHTLATSGITCCGLQRGVGACTEVLSTVEDDLASDSVAHDTCLLVPNYF
jgi:hypothetical protein